jgi:hypothetical protein
MANKKLGFDGQWVDGTPVGRHVDSEGDEVNIDIAFLEAVVANFEKTKHLHQPPAVIGHPTTTAPAYGYVAELRVNNGRLERRFSEVNSDFEEIVKSGAYKKRSDAFYLNPKIAPAGLVPALNHVGFLGAKAPAIKGIRDIDFSEDDGKTVTADVDTAISFSEGDTETMKDEDVQKTIRESVADFFKTLFRGEAAAPASASFSEADQKKLADDITKAVELKFSEELTARDTKIEALTKQVETQVDGSKRSQAEKLFAGFAEKGILPHALKERVTNLMEALAGMPDKKVTVIEFAEEAGRQVEKKTEHTLLAEFCEFVQALPPYVRFGESFGNVRLNGSGRDVLDPQSIEDKKNLRAAMGLKEPVAS